MVKKLIRLFKLCIIVGLLLGLSVFGIHFWVKNANKNRLFSSVDEIEHNKVGLVLGTSKYLSTGSINLYYKSRIEAAEALYKAGKIDFILISGDNSTKSYDEPSTFKLDLIDRGIPENKIYLDYAGFRTLDSVVRSKKIFGQTKLTFISQKFHNERALFLAKQKGIEAVGYNAKDVPISYGRTTQIRELLARVKMMVDLIIGVKPKYLGDTIEIK
jgi:SanA protein